MGQHYAFFAHFCAQNRAFPAIFDVPSNRLIPTKHGGRVIGHLFFLAFLPCKRPSAERTKFLACFWRDNII